MGFGSILKFSGKLAAKTGLLVGEMVCAAAEDAFKTAESKGVENRTSKSYSEQQGIWKSSAKKLSKMNSDIKLFDD